MFDKNKILGFLNLIRLKNCLLAWLAVVVGAYTSGFNGNSINLILACVIVTLITAAGNISNDIADLELDKKAKPNRPLASGLLLKKTAWITNIAFFVIGILLGFKISIIHGEIAFFTCAFLILYNFRLKGIPVVGNAFVAFMSGLPFVFGGFLSNDWKWSLIPFVFAVLLHFGREFLKSAEDVAGDTAYGIKTIAAYISIKSIRIISACIFAIVLVLSLLPVILGWYNKIYLVILLVGVFIPLIVVDVILFKTKLKVPYGLVHQLLKIEMLAGSVAILLAR